MTAKSFYSRYFQFENHVNNSKKILFDLSQTNSIYRIWNADGELWSNDISVASSISKHLKWLEIVEQAESLIGNLTNFVDEVSKVFTNVVLLGFGGSSVAKEA